MHVPRRPKTVVAVAQTDSLPDQPAIGASVYRPLGGDGWTAPHAQYSVLQQITGDMSGGTSTLILDLDTRWMNIVYLLETLYTGSTTTVDSAMYVISEYPPNARHRARVFGEMLFLSTLNDQGLLTWNPPLIVDAESVASELENGNNAIHNFNSWIYCFQKRALEKVPLNVLLAALPSTQFANVNTGS